MQESGVHLNLCVSQGIIFLRLCSFNFYLLVLVLSLCYENKSSEKKKGKQVFLHMTQESFIHFLPLDQNLSIIFFLLVQNLSVFKSPIQVSSLPRNISSNYH